MVLHLVPHAPRNLRQTQSDMKAAKVEWDDIPNYLRGGKLIGYNIKVNDGVEQFVHANTTFFIAANLKPYTNYTITVAGLTDSNTGQQSVIVASTLQARTLFCCVFSWVVSSSKAQVLPLLYVIKS